MRRVVVAAQARALALVQRGAVPPEGILNNMNDMVISSSTAPVWRKQALVGGGAAALLALGALAGVLASRPTPATPEASPTQAFAAPATAAVPPGSAGGLPAPKFDAAGHDRAVAAAERPVAPRGGDTVALNTQPAAALACGHCGVVESVDTVTHKGQGSGLGAVAGGVLGGVVGHQMGKGSGRQAMTVLGALGGGLAGNEIEKNQHSTTAYRVHVRMDDGSLRTVERTHAIEAGTRVTVDGQTLSVRKDATSAPPQGGRMLQTAAR
jgi:outer membrane lipoprotein SlyB